MYEESDPDFDPEKLHKGCKDDIASLLHSLICILEKNSIWLERDSDPVSNMHSLDKSQMLVPILSTIKSVPYEEKIPYNQIRFMFQKILMDNEMVPGAHNF